MNQQYGVNDAVTNSIDTLQQEVGVIFFIKINVKFFINNFVQSSCSCSGHENDCRWCISTLLITLCSLQNRCCGDTGGKSWNGTSWQQRDGNENVVPDSCCKTVSEGCGKRMHPSNINNEVQFKEHTVYICFDIIASSTRDSWPMIWIQRCHLQRMNNLSPPWGFDWHSFIPLTLSEVRNWSCTHLYREKISGWRKKSLSTVNKK